MEKEGFGRNGTFWQFSIYSVCDVVSKELVLLTME